MTRILFLAIVFLSVPGSAAGNPSTTVDESLHFTFSSPDGWKVETAPSAGAFLRLVATSPDETSTLRVYALHAAGDIDLEKLAEIDQRIDVLGSPSSSRKLRMIPWITAPHAVEKRYAPSAAGAPAIARFTADGTFGYVVVVHSNTLGESAMQELLDGFESPVTIGADLRNKSAGIRETGLLRSFGGWLGGILLALVAILTLYPLGKSGAQVRQGLRMHGALNEALKNMLAKGGKPNAKYRQFRGRASKKILIPIALWSFAYLVIYGVAPRELFLGSLALLAVPLLGFFGFFFSLSDDPGDYF